MIGSLHEGLLLDWILGLGKGPGPVEYAGCPEERTRFC